MKHVLFLGNSHLLSVLDAARDQTLVEHEADRSHSMWRSADIHTHDVELTGEPPMRARFVVMGAFVPSMLRIDDRGFFSVRERYRRVIHEATVHLDGRVDQVVSAFLGNEHTVFSLLEHPAPFDVLVDSADVAVAQAGPVRQVVPLGVIRRELSERANPTVLYCELLKSAFPDSEVVHLMPPPPIADEHQIRSNPDVFAKLIKQFDVAPAALRRKVYRIYTDVLRDRLGVCGVRLLTPPPEALDEGFLRREFWMGSTHANHGYGRLVLEQIGAA